MALTLTPYPNPNPNQVADGSEVESLHDEGLSGDCQRRLVGGEAPCTLLPYAQAQAQAQAQA